MEVKYFLYFLFGGVIVSAVTYFANTSKSLVAAFIGTLPVMTISTFLLIYFNAGQAAVLSYAKGLLIMILPWLVFIVTVILLAPRIHFFLSLVIGVALQILIALIVLVRSGEIHFRP